MDELRLSLSPELELIEGRIIGPVKELQGVMKLIRKNITKRDHKASFVAFLSPDLLTRTADVCAAHLKARRL